MGRRILLGAFGCAVLGILACNNAADTDVVQTAPVPDEPILTAPDSDEPAAPAEETTLADSDSTPSARPEMPELPAFTDPGDDAPAATVPEPAPADTPPVEPIVDGVVEFYAGIQSLKVTTELSHVVADGDGNPLPIPSPAPLVRELTLRRPNQFLTVAEDGGAPVVVSDGQHVSAYLETTEMFLEDVAPASLGDLTESDFGMTVAFAGPFQLIPFVLLSDNAGEKLMADVSEVKYVALEQIDETPAHHLSFVGTRDTPRGPTELISDLWIAAEGDPVILQSSMVQDQRRVSIPGEGPTTITFSLVEKLHSWEFNPELTDEMFVAHVPDTAREARDIFDLFEPSLLGRAAPEVKLPVLGSDVELDLASHQETNVVILDFWATWCGPCRDAMPIIAEVAEEYRERGVVVYAVNIDETEEQVQEFLEAEELGLTVAMDAGGTVATEFGVSSIPHSVIIGKNGLVQAVHVGLSPDLGNQLRRELDALLEEKDIFDGLPEAESSEAGEPAEGGATTVEGEAAAVDE